MFSCSAWVWGGELKNILELVEDASDEMNVKWKADLLKNKQYILFSLLKTVYTEQICVDMPPKE